VAQPSHLVIAGTGRAKGGDARVDHLPDAALIRADRGRHAGQGARHEGQVTIPRPDRRTNGNLPRQGHFTILEYGAEAARYGPEPAAVSPPRPGFLGHRPRDLDFRPVIVSDASRGGSHHCSVLAGLAIFLLVVLSIVSLRRLDLARGRGVPEEPRLGFAVLFLRSPRSCFAIRNWQEAKKPFILSARDGRRGPSPSSWRTVGVGATIGVEADRRPDVPGVMAREMAKASAAAFSSSEATVARSPRLDSSPADAANPVGSRSPPSCR